MLNRLCLLSKKNPPLRVFPTAGVGEVLPPAKICSFPPPGKIPPSGLPPTKERFSCYNPIKSSFLAVVIDPVPLFKFHILCTHRSCQFLILMFSTHTKLFLVFTPLQIPTTQ